MGALGIAALVAVVATGPVAGGAFLLTGTLLTASGPCGSAAATTQVAGLQLDAEQLANASTITAVTAGLRLPARAGVIAVATALQESDLQNLNYGDAAGPDSRGLFQQRIGYYGAAVATNPARATTAFLTRLVAVPNWASLPLTVAAATVQRPRADLVGAYGRWEQVATDLVGRDWPGPVSAGATANPSSPSSTGAPVSASGCDGAGAAAGSAGQGGLPAGYVLPTGTTAAIAVRQALSQLGKPYVWGGVGPAGFDCSGLTMTSWAAAGVALPRTAAAQSSTGVPVISTAAMQPGDLVFIAGSDGTAAEPGHLGMYIGSTNGVQYLVHAPQTGSTVDIVPVSRWAGLIVAIRRPVVQATH